MTTSASDGDVVDLDDEWCAHRFDHLSPEFGRQPPRDDGPHARATTRSPAARSTAASGWSAATRTWCGWRRTGRRSAPRTASPCRPATRMPALPEMVDPPLHREYKRLINAYFSPAVVARARGRAARPRQPAHRRLRRGRLAATSWMLRPAVPRAWSSSTSSSTHPPTSWWRSTAWRRSRPRRPRRRRSRPAATSSAGSASSPTVGGTRHPRATSSTRSSTPRSRAGRSPGTRSSVSSSCCCSAGSTPPPARSA